MKRTPLRSLRNGVLRYGRTAEEYLRSRRHRYDYAADTDGLEAFCLFIGYPRSGHSLVGSLLDAHPRMLIAHECDAARYIHKGFSREQLFYLLIENSREFARAGRTWTGYSYAVPGQWNGRYGDLKVIGDKKGDATSRRLGRHRGLLGRIRREIGLPLRLVHVIRNPWDNVATMARRDATPLQESLRRYSRMCHAAQRVRGDVDADEWLDVHHEDLIADPRGELSRLCAFLGQPAPRDYLEACAEILFGDPRRTRNEVTWTDELIERVETEICSYPAFARYRFDDAA